MKIFYVKDEAQGYFEDGTLIVAPTATFSSVTPVFPLFIYGNTYSVQWQNVKTKGEGLPSTWEKDDSFSGSDVSATLVFDNNYLHCYKSTLVSVGAVDEFNSGSSSGQDATAPYYIEVSITNRNLSDVQKQGTILLFDDDGNIEKVEYVDKEKLTTGFRFYINALPQKTYQAGIQVGIPESFYSVGTFKSEQSDIANGLFVFEVTFIGEKLNEFMLFDNQAYLDISYMAMRVLSDDKATEEVEYILPARINNSVSGLRNFRFNA